MPADAWVWDFKCRISACNGCVPGVVSRMERAAAFEDLERALSEYDALLGSQSSSKHELFQWLTKEAAERVMEHLQLVS